MANAPSPAQKERITEVVEQDVRRICRAWPLAVDEASVRGYRSNGGGVVPTEVRVDPSDPLHTRRSALTSAKPAAFGDPTGSDALRDDLAMRWLTDARTSLLFLLATSAMQAPGERRWSGAFDPHKLEGSLCMAARDIVELWPMRVQGLLDKISRLAFDAAKAWPPTPRKGDVIDGVTVGGKSTTVEDCTECGGPIAGGAGDPLARIDGRPYHRTPCYQTVWQRNRRRAGDDSRVA